MYECPNCGGNLKFDISSQQMACSYCDTHLDPYFVKKETDAVEEQFFEATVFTCPQCGGELYSIAFYKISLKKTVKSSCPSAARTWQAASFFYGTFCQAAKSFISVMGKPKSGNTEREPYRLSCLIKKIIYPNFPSTVHFSNTSHP